MPTKQASRQFGPTSPSRNLHGRIAERPSGRRRSLLADVPLLLFRPLGQLFLSPDLVAGFEIAVPADGELFRKCPACTGLCRQRPFR